MNKRYLLQFLVFLFFYLFTNSALSQYGQLDMSFGQSGIVHTVVGLNGYEEIWSLALQDSGKIVAAGYIGNGNDWDIALTRYKYDGNLDSTFSEDGIVVTPIGAGDDVIYSIATQDDGKIVAAGYTFNGTDNDFVLVRYNYNGEVDSTFGTNGIVTLSIGNDIFFSVAIQDDKKIVALGTSDNNYIVARFDENGNLDNTFNVNGIVTTPGGTFTSTSGSVLIQDDQKIIAARSFHNGSNLDFAVARLNSDGTVDNTFGTNGLTTTSIGSFHETIYSAAMQDDGKIVATGFYNSGSGAIDFAIVRYDTNGSLDNSFGTNGVVTTPVGVQNDYAYSVAVQSSGKILVGGTTRNIGDIPEFAVVRYNLDGTLDNTFGTNGIVITPVTVGGGDIYAGAHPLIIQPTGNGEDNIILGGSSYNSQLSGYSFFTLARYSAGSVTGVEISKFDSKPVSYVLNQNFPNPFNPTTIIRYSLPKDGIVTIKIYDIIGREITTLVNEFKTSGSYNLTWNASNLPSGVYFYKLQVDSYVETKKMILLK